MATFLLNYILNPGAEGDGGSLRGGYTLTASAVFDRTRSLDFFIFPRDDALSVSDPVKEIVFDHPPVPFSDLLY